MSRSRRQRPAAVEDEAFVTSLVPYGEDDVVVRLFTAGRGRLGAFARGARRSKRRFGGLMAPGRARVALVERPGSDLFVLEALDPDPKLFGLSADPRALGFASYVVELLERLLPELSPSPDLFVLADEVTARLSSAGADPRLLRAFELRLLASTGYLPDLSGPQDEPGAPSVAFDPARFHLLAHEAAGTVPFDEEARRAALLLLEADLDRLPELDEDVLRAVARLFGAHWRRQGQGPLKSVEFLRSLSAALG